MITFISRVENHQIHKLLDNGLEQTKKILHIDKLDNQAKESVERIEYVYQQINHAINNFDQLLVPVNTLNNGANQLQHVNNCLVNFYSNRQISYLNEANNYLDNFLPQITFLLSPNTPQEVENFRDSISSFRRSVAQHARNSEDQFKEIVDENNTLRKRITELNNQINSEKQRIDNIINGFQQQISSYQQQFSQAEDKRRETFVQVMEEHRDKFDEEKENRLNSYNEIISHLNEKNIEYEQRLISKNDKLELNYKHKMEDFENAVQEVLQTINNQKQQVEELVGVVTDTGLASGYHAVAKEEKRAKRFWRGVTVAAMLLLICFAVFIAYESYTKEFNLTALSAKLFGALSVGTLVAFSARQASLHGQAERTNRKMELQLKAIGPYLVGFEESEILEIKRSLVNKFFGQEDETATNDELPNASMDAVKMALETLQQFLVKSKG
ncbi:hypothetical protein [Paenibacillus sp. DYY-L-2]|uniref:hypothetical protein n=1 Tax=Paenibacillus sp. DYY-L-2 TaxID=3447013 RepID=UPI003F4F432C